VRPHAPARGVSRRFRGWQVPGAQFQTLSLRPGGVTAHVKLLLPGTPALRSSPAGWPSPSPSSSRWSRTTPSPASRHRECGD